MPWNDVWKFLLEVLKVGGTSAVIVFGLIKWFGDKWLDRRFASQLENLKHENQKELENVKHTIQSTFSRIVKVHEREYRVLPKAWFMLHVAYGSAQGAVAHLKTRPDFWNMSEGDLEELLKRSKLLPHQQDTMRAYSPSDRQAYFSERMSDLEVQEAADKRREFNNYLIEHRIFMTKELADLLDELSGVYFSWPKRIRKREKTQRPDPQLISDGIEKITRVGKRLPDVQTLIQERLGYEKA